MAMKPPCQLRCTQGTMFSILFCVRDTLREANLQDQLDEFLERAVVCRSWADMMRLAREYVELDDQSPA